MATVYLGLGSNLGDREENLKKAVAELNGAGISVEKLSAVIESDPVGGPPQGRYLNAVGRARTELSPEDLLKQVKAIETKLGRTKNVRNGPREIDIDILFYDRRRIATTELTVPHPRLFERSFVLEPLKEIAPGFLEEFRHDHR